MGRTTHSRQAARSRRRLQLGPAGTAVVIAVLAVVVLTLVGGPTGGGAGAADAPVDATQASIGKLFPHFTLTGADGKAVTGTARSGRPSIVRFTDAACVPASWPRSGSSAPTRWGWPWC